MKKNKKVAYVGKPKSTYLQFLLAFENMFTNKQNVLPIIDEFNFYINGAYSTPLTDLFRMYEENFEDIHGAEKTKELIDNETVGIINEYIYNANGSLLQALENLRVYILDRKNKYNIVYNPMSNIYTETLKTVVNVLDDANPIVNGKEQIVTPALEAPKKKKSLWRLLGFLVYKPKVKTL